jgi:hypothetical protein
MDKKTLIRTFSDFTTDEKRGLQLFCRRFEKGINEAIEIQLRCSIKVTSRGSHMILTEQGERDYLMESRNVEHTGDPEPSVDEFKDKFFYYTVDFEYESFRCPACRNNEAPYLSRVQIHEKNAHKIVQRVRPDLDLCMFHRSNCLNFLVTRQKSNKLIAVVLSHLLNSPSREQRCTQVHKIVKDTMTMSKFSIYLRNTVPITDADFDEMKKNWNKFFKTRYPISPNMMNSYH